MQDAETTIDQLRQVVDRFVAERDWHQFHTPKNLAMSLAIEAAELMEHFQWITTEASREVGNNPVKKEAICDELADVLCYVCAIANELDRRRFGVSVCPEPAQVPHCGPQSGERHLGEELLVERMRPSVAAGIAHRWELNPSKKGTVPF